MAESEGPAQVLAVLTSFKPLLRHRGHLQALSRSCVRGAQKPSLAFVQGGARAERRRPVLRCVELWPQSHLCPPPDLPGTFASEAILGPALPVMGMVSPLPPGW